MTAFRAVNRCDVSPIGSTTSTHWPLPSTICPIITRPLGSVITYCVCDGSPITGSISTCIFVFISFTLISHFLVSGIVRRSMNLLPYLLGNTTIDKLSTPSLSFISARNGSTSPTKSNPYSGSRNVQIARYFPSPTKGLSRCAKLAAPNTFKH